MASRGINKVILVGNLGKDPDVRYSAGGQAVTSVSIATSESWKDKNTGQMNERTEWHNITFFGKLAEIAGEYLRKGSQVYVEGKLKTDKYQDKTTGQDRYSTGIAVDSFTGVLQMLGGQPNGSQQMPSQAQMQDPNQAMNQEVDKAKRHIQHKQGQHPMQQKAMQQQAPTTGFNDSFKDDEIPF